MCPHEQGGPPVEEVITVVHIMDCPTIAVHAEKWYKALIDSDAGISLLRYSAYKNIEDPHTTHHNQIKHNRWFSNVSTRNDCPTSENC